MRKKRKNEKDVRLDRHIEELMRERGVSSSGAQAIVANQGGVTTDAVYKSLEAANMRLYVENSKVKYAYIMKPAMQWRRG